MLERNADHDNGDSCVQENDANLQDAVPPGHFQSMLQAGKHRDSSHSDAEGATGIARSLAIEEEALSTEDAPSVVANSAKPWCKGANGHRNQQADHTRIGNIHYLRKQATDNKAMHNDHPNFILRWAILHTLAKIPDFHENGMDIRRLEKP